MLDINFWSVNQFREAGLEAKWTKKNGSPRIVLRNPNGKSKHQRETWWILDKSMSESMKEHGIVEEFDCCTLLGDLFSVSC